MSLFPQLFGRRRPRHSNTTLLSLHPILTFQYDIKYTSHSVSYKYSLDFILTCYFGKSPTPKSVATQTTKFPGMSPIMGINDTLFQKSKFCPKIRTFGMKNYLLGWLTIYRLGWVEFYRHQKIQGKICQNLLFEQKLDLQQSVQFFQNKKYSWFHTHTWQKNHE